MFMKNIDVLTMINYFIGSFSCCIAIIFAGKFFLKVKFKDIKFYKYFYLLAFTIFYIINSLVFDNIVKLLGTLLILFLNYKLIFKQNSLNCIFYAIATCLIFTVSETLFVLLSSLVDYIFAINFASKIIKSSYANIAISVFVIILSYFSRNIIQQYILKLNKRKNGIIIFVGVITTLVTLASIYKLSNNNWKFSYAFVLNLVIIIGCILLMIILIRQYIETKEVTKKYKLQEEFLKTSADLIERYGSTIHKYKNNLITIRGYINSDKEKATTYVDSLLENYKEKKYSWVSKINYLEIDTLRYLIYYKLSKAEDNNLKLVITVNKDFKNIKYKELTVNQIGILADIIGEYLDNAIYAATESNEKMLILDLYIQDNIINFVLSNTYKNKFDINLITKSGYTTKGKGHGLGLYDIDKQIKKLPYVEKSYDVMGEYFIVNIKLDIIDNNIKKEKIKKKVD